MAVKSDPSMNCPHHPKTTLDSKTSPKPYRCHACNMGGVGPHHGCPKCDYELHNECMFPSYKLTPTFLSGQVFEFKGHPPPLKHCTKKNCKDCGCWCDACGMEVTGCHYYCNKDGLVLHPCCMNLEKDFNIQGIKFNLKMKKMLVKCDCCDSKRVEGSSKDFSGWYYESLCKNYCYHVFCIMNMGVKSLEKVTCGTSNNVIESEYKYYGLALEKIEVLPVVKKKKNDGKNGNKYWKMLKMLVTVVLSVLFGDPTTLAIEAFALLFS